jgi:hypothetical protein
MIATTNSNIPNAAGLKTLPGEAYTAAALGVFDGATVTFQAYIDDAWRAIPDAAFTADAAVVIDTPAAQALRGVVTNASTDTEISVTITKFMRG